MHCKIQYKNVAPILTFVVYTEGDTLVGRIEPKLNMGRLGGYLDSGSWRSTTGNVGICKAGSSKAGAGSREPAAL